MSESKHRYHPAFEEGKYANTEGIRRGQNPYSAGGNQDACYAWWAGWDEADDEYEDEYNDSQPSTCPDCGSPLSSLDIAKEWETDHVERWVDHCSTCGWTDDAVNEVVVERDETIRGEEA